MKPKPTPTPTLRGGECSTGTGGEGGPLQRTKRSRASRASTREGRNTAEKLDAIDAAAAASLSSDKLASELDIKTRAQLAELMVSIGQISTLEMLTLDNNRLADAESALLTPIGKLSSLRSLSLCGAWPNSRPDCRSTRADSRKSHRRTRPLLLLYTSSDACCGWNSAAVITSESSSMSSGLMSTMLKVDVFVCRFHRLIRKSSADK